MDAVHCKDLCHSAIRHECHEPYQQDWCDDQRSAYVQGEDFEKILLN